MFSSREAALGFRNDVVDEMRELRQQHDLLWHVSPDLEGVQVRLRPDESTEILVIERLEGEGYRIIDQGTTDDGEWRDIEVRPD